MKKSYACLVMALFLGFGGSYAVMAEEAAAAPQAIQKTEAAPQTVQQAEPAPQVEQKTEEGGGIGENLFHMGRGVVNIGTCWLEIFRCMLYRNAEAPFWGFVSGAVEGSGFTVIRAFTGVTDILFFGFEPGNIFEPRFAEFVWQSPWMPVKKLQLKGPILKQD